MTTETKEKKTRTPRKYESVLLGALNLSLAERVKLKRELIDSIESDLKLKEERIQKDEEELKAAKEIVNGVQH